MLRWLWWHQERATQMELQADTWPIWMKVWIIVNKWESSQGYWISWISFHLPTVFAVFSVTHLLSNFVLSKCKPASVESIIRIYFFIHLTKLIYQYYFTVEQMQMSDRLPVSWINDELCLQEVEEVHCAEQERYHRAGSEDGRVKEALREEMPAGCSHQMVELGKVTQEDTGW